MVRHQLGQHALAQGDMQPPQRDAAENHRETATEREQHIVRA